MMSAAEITGATSSAIAALERAKSTGCPSAISSAARCDLECPKAEFERTRVEEESHRDEQGAARAS